jgi:hypothetical protein
MTREDDVAAQLLKRYGDAVVAAGQPLCVEVRDRDGELESRPNPDGWLGRTLDPAWDAVALVATGRARVAHPSVEPPARLLPAMGGGLRLACAVWRTGEVGWSMTLPDGSEFAETPSEGRLLDMLRRSAGLETSPPPCGASVTEVIIWLAAIREAAGTQARRLGWDEAVTLHPAIKGFEGCEPGAAQLLILLRARQLTWTDLRQRAVHDLVLPWMPPPETANWMDDGMFARWVLADLPTVDDLLRQVRPKVSADAYRRIHHLIQVVDRASSSEAEPPAA